MKVTFVKPNVKLAPKNGALIFLVDSKTASSLTKPAKCAEFLKGYIGKKDLTTGISQTLKKREFKGAAESFIGVELLVNLKSITASMIAFVGLGDFINSDGSEDNLKKSLAFRKSAKVIATNLEKSGVSKCLVVTPEGKKKPNHSEPFDFNAVCPLESIVEGFALTDYRFKEYLGEGTSKKKRDKKQNLNVQLKVSGSTVDSKAGKSLWDRSTVLAQATNSARTLVNLAPRDCNPKTLAEHCQVMSKRTGLKCEVYEEKKLRSLGADCILSVGAGAAVKPRLIIMKYIPEGAKKDRDPKDRVALVGKGITYDSGGLCLKTAPMNYIMKMDMGGAAAVVGAMEAIAQIKPDREVWGYVPTAENLVGAGCYHPGDVLTAINGKTIEVLNTDAEGRLILADALSLASQDEAGTIIDLATLTGACLVALGQGYAATYTDDDELFNKANVAANRSAERLWRMPLPEDYKELLKSPIADIKNIASGSWGGSITAALFLSEFVGDASWMHLDIAGVTFADKATSLVPEGGVGFGVRTLTRLIEIL